MLRLKALYAAAGASLALAAAACGNGPPASSSGGSGGGGGCSAGTSGSAIGSAQVKVNATDGLVFSPATTTAKVGQVVSWQTTGGVPHTIAFDTDPCLTDNQSNGEPLNPGSAGWEIKFTQAGTYKYHCTIHPGMDGTITVSG